VAGDLRAELYERWLFLHRYVRSARFVGAVTPSSRSLVRTLLAMGDLDGARLVVELGPGTGPFTAGLLARLGPDARLVCIERDRAFVRHLQTRFRDPRLTVVCGEAEHLEAILGDLQLGAPACIVSGLPLTSLPGHAREAILGAVSRALPAGGRLLLYQYTLLMRGHLRRHFRSVTVRWEARNLPPAACIACTDPFVRG
jgi:phospholipid N-methyltransferase